MVRLSYRVSNPGTIPSGFCAAGFDSLNIAFIISLLVDIVFQVNGINCRCGIDVPTQMTFQLYMFFLVWRFSKRLEHYSSMKGPYYGGEEKGNVVPPCAN